MPISAADFLKSLKEGGLVIVKGDFFYFVPVDVMNEHKLPKEFQKGFDRVSPDYFDGVEPASPPAGPATTPPSVHRELDRLFSNFKVAQGVNQAIWLGDVQEKNGKQVSIPEGSQEVMFCYNNASGKILVDLNKGGKPSNK